MSVEFVDDRVVEKEEDWGEDAFNAEPCPEEAQKAICPAEMIAMDKFTGMLQRGSPEVAWRVALKTVRKNITGDERVPMGFPSLFDFFEKAKDFKTFEWGWKKYVELYTDGPWTKDDSSSGHPVQELRENIPRYYQTAEEHAALTKEEMPLKHRARITKTHQEIVAWLAVNSLFTGCDFADYTAALRSKVDEAINGRSEKKRAREEDSGDGRVSPSLRLSSE